MTLSISGTTGLTSTDTQISYQAGNTTTGTGGFISNTSIIFLGNNTINATMNTTSLKIGGTFGIGGGNALQGEFTATGLTVYAAGVTPQHDGPLHVMSGSAGSWSPNSAADELIVESSGSGGISIATPDASVGYLLFSSPTVTGAYGGLLQYQYSGGAFVMENLKSGGSIQFRPSDGSARGEWNTTGLTCYASGVTAQHDGVLHVMEGTAGAVTAGTDANTIIAESNADAGISILNPDANLGIISFGTASSNRQAQVVWNNNSNLMRIGTAKASAAVAFEDQSFNEVMRLSGNGRLWIGKTSAFSGNGHGAQWGGQWDYVFDVRHNGTTLPFGLLVSFSAAAPNDTTSHFINCQDSSTSRMRVLSNGNVQNTNNSYGALSDERLKQDIVPATSQWRDIKALAAVAKKYRIKSDVTEGKDHQQLGLVAQDVLSISPGLVQVGADGMYSVQYSVLYMKAVKALGEALERIENLEAAAGKAA